MPQDDEHGFWDDAPGRSHTGSIPRLTRRAQSAPRRARVDRTGPTSITSGRFDDGSYSPESWADDDPDEVSMWADVDHATPLLPLRRSRTERPPNFVMRRIAALVALGAVAAPVALLIGGGNDGAQVTADSTQTTVIADPLATVAVNTAIPSSIAPIATAAPSTQVAVASTAVPTSAPASTAAPVTTLAAATTAPETTAPAAAPAAETTAAAVESAASRAAAIAAADDESASTVVDAPSTSASVAARVACVNDYEVVVGDYWILIADKVSVDLGDLLDVNGATTDTPLYPKRTICLPAGASAPTTATPTTAAPTTAAPTTAAPATAAPTTTAKATTTTAAPTTTTVKQTTTTAAPSTTVSPPRNSYSKVEVIEIIRNVWPDELEDEAIRIATRESNLIPTVRNSCCFGLFQLYWNVHKGWMTEAGVTSSDQLFDPTVNAYLAYAMYLRAGGWGPWAL